MEGSFIAVSGVLNVVAGVALLVYWYSFAVFLPYKELATTLAILIKNRNWTWINALGALGAMLGVLGQAGMLAVQIDDVASIGVIGFFIASAGTILLIGTMLWETILWPILVNLYPELFEFEGALYKSKTFVPFFVVSGLIYALGYVLVGVGIMQAGKLPKFAGILMAIGSPLFGLGSMFGKYQVYPRTLGVTMLSAALIWLGFAMTTGV